MIQIKNFVPLDHKVKAVIYGASGAWKTVFGATAPKPIFASAEGGLLSVADKNIQFVEIKSLKDLQELLIYLKTEKHDFETVVIDSITEINDIIKQDIEKRTGKWMQLQDWWELAKKIKAILRWFRDLDMHVIFLAQEVSESDEGVVTKIVPSLNGKAATEIAYFMDNVGYLMIDKTGERKLLTQPNAKLLTKDRSWLIWNDCPVDFSEWVNRVKKIKTGTQVVSVDFEAEIDEKTWNELPQPKKAEPMITEATGSKLFEVWSEMWDLSIEVFPDEIDSKGTKRYTAEKSEPTRIATLESKFKVDSSTKLTEAQALEFIASCQNRIAEIKKIQDLKKETLADPEPEPEPEEVQAEVPKKKSKKGPEPETVPEPVEESPVKEPKERKFGE